MQSPSLLKLFVPTYNASAFPDAIAEKRIAENGAPRVPILVTGANVVRVVLGSHDVDDREAPDILIQRQPQGWVLFLHPRRTDAAGLLFFFDDGRCVLQKDRPSRGTATIEVVEWNDAIPWPRPEEPK